MKLSTDQIQETINVARGSLADRDHPTYQKGTLAYDFAEALVQVADSCVVGLPCEKHGGAIHGQEAEELRAGVERILKNTSSVEHEDNATPEALSATRKALISLLDRVDARDSLAFREATDASSSEEAPR